MAKAEGGFAYSADLKCCTYFPLLTNFQVGALLTEPNISFSALTQLKNFIFTDQAQPLGVAPHFDYQKKYLKRGLEAFGRDRELRCPYFDVANSRCGIWNWRGAVCTSFYCESSYGLKGIEFWRELEKYLLNLERTLSYDAILYLGFNEVEAQLCLKALPQGYSQPFRFKESLWLEMKNERVEFYRKSFHYVESLSVVDFQKLIGGDLILKQRELYHRAIELTCK